MVTLNRPTTTIIANVFNTATHHSFKHGKGVTTKFFIAFTDQTGAYRQVLVVWHRAKKDLSLINRNFILPNDTVELTGNFVQKTEQGETFLLFKAHQVRKKVAPTHSTPE